MYLRCLYVSIEFEHSAATALFKNKTLNCRQKKQWTKELTRWAYHVARGAWSIFPVSYVT